MTAKQHSDEVGCIPLTKGNYAIVDVIDADLTELKWHINNRYASRYYGKGAKHRYRVNMHRIILQRILDRPLVKGEEVDHINGDRLDNRRENLRVATHSQNAANAGRQRNNKSGFKGVHWRKQNQRWITYIKHNGKMNYIGAFDTPEAAHEAYREAATKFFGEFARFE